jgi:anti-sigma-K factor RskA
MAAEGAAVAEHSFAGMTCAEVADLAPAFVLGALTAAESGAVRDHLAECPELHAEMAELNSVVPALFEAVEPAAPPAGLKDRIMAAAAADVAARREPMSTPSAAPRPAGQPPATAAPRRSGDLGAIFRRPLWAGVAAAALVAAIALGAWNVQLRDQIAGLEAYRTGVTTVLDRAAEPGAQVAVLTDPAGAGGPTGLAAVAADGSVALVMRNLAPTSGSQVYEAWLIAGKQAPVPIGGFAVGRSGSGSLVAAHAPLGDGVVVALTLEPQEGAKTPTLPIKALGAAHAQAG